MTTPIDDRDRDAINAALDILRYIRDDTENGETKSWQLMLRTVEKHGWPVVGIMWLIWARDIAIALRNAGNGPDDLYSHVQGDPNLRYARGAVTIASFPDPDPADMAELLNAAVNDTTAKRTGAHVTTISAMLATAAALGPGPKGT